MGALIDLSGQQIHRGAIHAGRNIKRNKIQDTKVYLVDNKYGEGARA